MLVLVLVLRDVPQVVLPLVLQLAQVNVILIVLEDVLDHVQIYVLELVQEIVTGKKLLEGVINGLW